MKQLSLHTLAGRCVWFWYVSGISHINQPFLGNVENIMIGHTLSDFLLGNERGRFCNYYRFVLSFRCSTTLMFPRPLAHSKKSNTSHEWNFVIWTFHGYVWMLRFFRESEKIYRHACLCSKENFVSKRLCNLEIVTLSAFLCLQLNKARYSTTS